MDRQEWTGECCRVTVLPLIMDYHVPWEFGRGTLDWSKDKSQNFSLIVKTIYSGTLDISTLTNLQTLNFNQPCMFISFQHNCLLLNLATFYCVTLVGHTVVNINGLNKCLILKYYLVNEIPVFCSTLKPLNAAVHLTTALSLCVGICPWGIQSNGPFTPVHSYQVEHQIT